jgi:O-antigen ligase
MQQNVLSKRQFFVGLGMMILFMSLALPLLPEFLQPEIGFKVGNVMERVDWLFNPLGIQDASALERKKVAELSWKMFTDHPFVGNGLGSTEAWSESQSTHNMYLYLMADHGIIGVMILPLLCLAVVWRSYGEARQIAIPFVLFILFFGFFSHNVIDDYCTLIAFALMAAMSIRSQYV